MSNWRRVLATVVGSCVAATVAATGAFAQSSIEERVEALEKKFQDRQKAMEEVLGFQIHALLMGSANYNFNTPDSSTNRIHVFDQDAQTIQLDTATVFLRRDVPKGVSFGVDFYMGKIAEVVGNSTYWSNNLNSTESKNSLELVQAYVKYSFEDLPFSITGGKFVTFHGTEVIPTYSNFNYNISNSILFGYAIPFTHTGIYGTYTLPESWGSFSLGVINGWDDVVDNNDSKSVTSNLSLTPPDSIFSFSLATTYGAEQPDSGRSKRLLVTPLVGVKLTDQISLYGEYDYGNESNVALVNGSLISNAPGNAQWYGAAGYLVYTPADDWTIALRGEWFSDVDGVRTLYQEPGYGPGADFWAVTPTLAYKVTDGLLWRAEYRHDESDRRYFDKDAKTNPLGVVGQDIISTQLIYAF